MCRLLGARATKAGARNCVVTRLRDITAFQRSMYHVTRSVNPGLRLLTAEQPNAYDHHQARKHMIISSVPYPIHFTGTLRSSTAGLAASPIIPSAGSLVSQTDLYLAKMPRKQPSNPQQSAAILPVSSGKKKVFGDDDQDEDEEVYDFSAKVNQESEDSEEDDDDDDDDDAPEAVGLAVGKDAARLEEEERLAYVLLRVSLSTAIQIVQS